MIRLFTAGGMWVADNSRAADADTVFRLFGNYQLPTPFDDTVPADKVQAAIAKLNPNEEVVISS